MRIPPPPWWLIPALIALVAAFRWDPARSAPTPTEWFHLVLDLQNTKQQCLYGPDRQFLREMINALTVRPDAMPTAAQQRWLLSLKKECKL